MNVQKVKENKYESTLIHLLVYRMLLGFKSIIIDHEVLTVCQRMRSFLLPPGRDFRFKEKNK